MNVSSKTSSNIFQRAISIFLTIAVIIGLLPAFGINASAAVYWGDLEKLYPQGTINNNLKVGQKIKLKYVYNTNPGGGIADRDKLTFLKYTNGNLASMSPGFWVGEFEGDNGMETIDTMPAYCIDHGSRAVGENSVLTLAEYLGESGSKALVAGVFANGYRNIPYEIFTTQLVANLESPVVGYNFKDSITPADRKDDWLTEEEYQYATQLATWAALRQIGVQDAAGAVLQAKGSTGQNTGNGTLNLSTGNEVIAKPDPNDQAKYRVYMAILAILVYANSFASIYGSGGAPDAKVDIKKGLYTFDDHVLTVGTDENKHALQQAADENRDGIKIENIGGIEYYTREFIAYSPTSPAAAGYQIMVRPYWKNQYNTEKEIPSSEQWAPGVILTDLNDNELTKNGDNGYRLNVAHDSHSGDEVVANIGSGWVTADDYWGRFKVCIPTSNTNAPANEDTLYLHVTTVARNYEIFRALNERGDEQNLILGDNGLARVRGNGTWEFTGNFDDTGRVEVYKTNEAGDPLTGARFHLESTDANFNDEQTITDSSGRFVWDDLLFGTYTLTETQAPSGYHIQEPYRWEFTLDEDHKTFYKEITNSNQKYVGILKRDIQTQAPIGNVTFFIEQIDGTFSTYVTTDSYGYRRLTPTDLPYGTYKITEIGVPSGYVLDPTPQTLHWTGLANEELVFENARKMGFRIVKADSETNERIPGAWFDVYKNGAYITSVGTNDAGYAVVSGLETGYYEVQETYVPGNYIPVIRPQGIYLDVYNPAVEPDPVLTAYNSTKPSLIIRKYAEGTTAEDTLPLDGVTFRVSRDAMVIGEYITPYYRDMKTGTVSISGEAGVITLHNIEPGTYTVEEIAAPQGYLVPDNNTKTIEIPIGTQKNFELEFFNSNTPGVRIIKMDAITKQRLPDAVFNLKYVGTNGSYDKDHKTNENGVIELSALLNDEVLPEGAYEIREKEPPEGWLAKEEVTTVFLAKNATTPVVFSDYRVPRVTLKKYDPVGDKFIPGATFRIYKVGDENNTRMAVTDSDGQIFWNEGYTDDYFRPGQYYIEEMAVPKGYVLNTTRELITLYPGVDARFVFNNARQIDLQIIKLDAITRERVDDAVFSVRRIGGSETTETVTTVVTGKQPVWFEEGPRPNYTHWNEGEAWVEGLDPGVYEITEVSVPDPYLVSEPPNNVQLIELIENRTAQAVFENYKKTIIITHKYDEDTQKPLQYAEFSLKKKGSDVVIGEGLTNDEGYIQFPAVGPGWYTVTEMAPPPGYLPAEQPSRDIEVKLGQSDIHIKFDNKQEPGLIIWKYDMLTAQTLPNTEFSVAKRDGPVIYEGVTSSAGFIYLPNLEDGWYTVTEMAPPPGYLQSDTPSRDVYVEAGKTMENGGLLEIKFDNIRKPTLIVTKINGLTYSGIPNATFTIEYEMAGGGIKSLGSFRTDANGRITIPNAEPGWYIITETKAAPGFSLPSNPVTRKYLSPGENSYTAEETAAGASDAAGEDSNMILSGSAGSGILGGMSTLGAGIGVFGGDDFATLEGENGEEIIDYPLNSLVIKKSDSATGELLAGADFVVRQMTEEISGTSGTVIGTYTTGHSGIIVITGLEPGGYIVEETKAPANYVLEANNQQQAWLKPDGTSIVELNFHNVPYGSILITKVDAKTNAPLANTKFRVTDNGGAVVGNTNGEYTTDENGEIIIPNVKPGSYVITEIEATENYAIDTMPQTLIVGNDGKTYKASFKNQPFGGLTIRKLDRETKQPLESAEFKVTVSDGSVVGVTNGIFKTDINGLIQIPNLPKNTYVITETKAPNGYVLEQNTQSIALDYGKSYTVDVYNSKMSGAQIIKLDSVTKKGLKDAQFTVYKKNGELLGNYTTDANGIIIIGELEPGWYKAVESKAPLGYVLDDTPQDFEVTSAEFIKLTFENIPQSGLTIIKRDEATGAPLKGVVFDVRVADGQLVTGNILDGNQPWTENNSPNSTASMNGTVAGSYTTDANGRIQINGLDAGLYYVIERKALDGYELDTEVHPVTVTAGRMASLQLTNRQKAGLRLLKVDALTKAPIYNVEFMVFDMNGKVVGTYYTDNSGLIDFSGILTEGRYTIRETRPAAGYYGDDTPKTVEFVSGKITEIVWTNTPQLAQLQITKVSGDDNEVNALPAGTPLEGAIFEIYEHKSGNLVDRISSGADGRAVSKALPLGRYSVKEVQAPKWYKISDQALDIDLEFATQIVKLTFVNYSANTGVSIKKTGNVEAMPGDEIRYDIKEVKNTSTVALTDFYWRDIIPVDSARLTKISTGTYNQSLKYKVQITTNKGNTRLIADNLSTTQNNNIDCSPQALGLASDEYVTNVTLLFGTVRAGFTSLLAPRVYVTVLNVADGHKFVNRADVGGKYGTEWVVASANWTVSVYNPNFGNPAKPLPRTGY